MKDIVLSLLSRGCGQVVQTEDKNEGGRLEVCFEPEDYFNWKSQQTLLRLTRSGRFWTKDEPTPPKTYSTRRGPLVLYSQDLALSSRQPDDVSTKTWGPRRSRQEVELRVRTLRELKGAILTYGKKQPLRWYGSQDTHPPLPIPSPPKLLPPVHTTQRGLSYLNPGWQPKTVLSDPAGPPGCYLAQPRQEAAFLSTPKPHRAHVGLLVPLPEERPTCSGGTESHSLENQIFQTQDLEKSTDHRDQKAFTVSIMVETPRVLMSPVPEMEFDTQKEHSANTEDPKDTQVEDRVIGCSGHIGPGGKCTAVGASGAGEPCPLRTACVDDSWESSPISHVTYYGGHLGGARARGILRHKKPDPGNKRENMASQPDLTSVHLPPLPMGALVGQDQARDRTVPPEGTAQQETETADVRRHPETRFCKFLLPLFVTARGEQGNSPHPQGGAYDSRFGDRKADSSVEETGQDTVCTNTGGPASEKSAPILHSNSFDPDCLGMPELEEDEAPSLGVLPPLVGSRGPGKQSSMALHWHGPNDLHNTPDPHHAERDVVKGNLPAVLRDWEKGGATGTLIMGPNGEIIRLSIWPPADDVNSQQLLNNVIQEQALSYLSSEAVLDAPWTFALQRDSGVEVFTESTIPISNPTYLGQQTIDKQGSLGQLGSEKSQGAQSVCGKAAERMGPSLQSKEQKTTATPKHLLAAASSTLTSLARPSLPMSTSKHEPWLPPLSKEIQKPTKKVTKEPQPRLGNTSWGTSPKQEMDHNSPVAPAQPYSNDNSIVHLQASKKNLRTTTELPSAWQSKGFPQQAAWSETSGSEALNTYREQAKADDTQTRGRKQDTRDKGRRTKGSSVEKHSRRFTERRKKGSVKERGKDLVDKHRSSSVKRQRSGSVEGNRSSSIIRHRSSSEKRHTRGSEDRHERGSVKQHGSGSIERHQSSSKQRHRNGSIQRNQSSSIKKRRNSSIQRHQSSSVQRDRSSSIQTRRRGSIQRHTRGSVEKWKQSVEEEGPHREPGTQVPEGPKKLRRRKTKGEKVQKNSFSENGMVVSKRRKKKVKGQTEFVVGKPRERLLDRTPESRVREDVTKKVKVPTTSEGTAEDRKVGSEYRSDSRLSGKDTDHEDYTQEEEEDWEFTYMSHSSLGGRSSSGRGTDRPVQPEETTPHQEQVPSHGQVQPPATTPDTKDQKPTFNPDAGSNMDILNKKALLYREQQVAELAERAERRRREVERKRQEREEEKRRQQEREEREERLRLELEMEQQRRAEELRLKRLKEQQERQRQEEQELERMRREQAEKEAEKRMQEEKRRQMQHLLKLRQEEQERRAAELERQRVEQEAREAEEKKRLQEMEESELREYLRRQQEAEEERRRVEAERKRIEEEEMRKAVEAARLQAEIFARQRAILEQKLQFQRDLLVEAEALGLTQDISRPWVYSYFSLLNMLGLPASPTGPEDLTKDSRE